MHTAKTSEPNNLVLHHKTINTYQLEIQSLKKIGFSHENGLTETALLFKVEISKSYFDPENGIKVI